MEANNPCERFDELQEVASLTDKRRLYINGSAAAGASDGRLENYNSHYNSSYFIITFKTTTYIAAGRIEAFKGSFKSAFERALFSGTNADADADAGAGPLFISRGAQGLHFYGTSY